MTDGPVKEDLLKEWALQCGHWHRHGRCNADISKEVGVAMPTLAQKWAHCHSYFCANVRIATPISVPMSALQCPFDICCAFPDTSCFSRHESLKAGTEGCLSANDRLLLFLHVA